MITIEFHHLVAFAVALIVAFFATPIARKIAVNSGAVNIPNDSRRIHKKPMALMGGLAIIAGFVLATIYSFATKDIKSFTQFLTKPKTLGILAGVLIIIVLGIIDDIKALRARIKFPVQLIAAIIVVATGTRITTISKPFQETVALHPGMMYMLGDILAFIISIIWIVGMTNAINLIDGLDGLAAGVSGIAAITLYIVAVIRKQDDIAIISVSLVGAIAGFLPYNFNPAKIFMGDTGATFLGFILAIISIEGTMKSVTALAVAIPILVLGLPIFDTMFAIIRRLLHGRPIAEADRGHLHHRLLDMGLSHRMAVISLYIVSGALGLVSIALVDKGLLPSIILLIIIVMFGIGGARNLKEISVAPEDKCMDQKKPIENTEHKDAQLEAASGIKQEESSGEKAVSGAKDNKDELKGEAQHE
ncbi:MAG TPA: undecaprenyl/decaprenyl-phosphate alpha-N-acetylglucosaminyl 1-phosphate transferase [Clostridiaceae bacterium]|jgi:UDP-GlcNAc:undecaprenyl-phosphate GlcNAc-1-phosphate transferase|nr:undecaprenyl/decaprenyl-phosphate alpha-N-acetylglucosaminyl 1-phosphate transferase [Clostridiaceae bacterium]